MFRCLGALLVFFPLAFHAHAAEPSTDSAALQALASPVRSVDFNDTDFSDLADFGKAVGNARYVVLGEKTHGEGNVFALKARLVRYLHQKLGFEVLALESGLYDGVKINALRDSGKPMKTVAPGNLFFMYSTTREVTPLFDYLDNRKRSKRPLLFTTFDSQQSGNLSQQDMLVDLAAYLLKRDSDLPRTFAWRIFAAQCQNLLHFERTPPPAGEQRRFFETLRLIDQVTGADVRSSTRPLDDPGFWKRVSASLRSQAEAFWQTPPDQRFNAPREREMTANMLWVLQHQHPGKKVIIWTHDFHGQKISALSGAKGMMVGVRETLPGRHFYHAYFTGYHGKYVDFIKGGITEIPEPDPKSIEHLLHHAGMKQVFIDLKKARQKGSNLEGYGFGDYEGRFTHGKPSLGEYVDGVFFLDRITPATRMGLAAK
ncbi:MAG: hypothetical protein K0S28_1426 [Paucimonas sp.]|nr:hypothetical protein [Paucimonas sp.]